MSSRNRPLTPKAIAKRIADGFGPGRGGGYKPWHIVQRTASRGVSYRLPGWTDARVAHTLSALEKRYFLILDWSPRVTEVREQYALPLADTLAIAAELGIDHARERRTSEKTPVPLSTDFLLTVQASSGPILVARTVKYAADLSDERVIEKFEIERAYWERRGVRWGIVTERDIPEALVKNIVWVHPFRILDGFSPLDDDDVRRIAAVLTRLVLSQDKPFRVLTNACDDLLGYDAGSSLTVARHLLATRQWLVDMEAEIHLHHALALRGTCLRAPGHEGRAAG